MNTKDFIILHRNDDIYKLALQKAPDNVDLSMALQQINAYQVLEKKVPSWAKNDDLIFPKKISLEQCSSEHTACHKSNIIKDFIGKTNFSMADLTGGMGIDCFFLSQYSSICHYVEKDAELCKIAEHNFSIMAPNIKIHNYSAEYFIDSLIAKGQKLDLIYIDPSRRGDHGQKLVSIADCQPNIIALYDKLFNIAESVVIKLSPMLDICRAINELPSVTTVYILSVNNECKELLLFLKSGGCNNKSMINAVNIDNDGTASDCLSGSFSEESSLSVQYAESPMKLLYEPYAAHLKSGLYKTIAHRYNVHPLHVNSHIYTSENLIENFPGRKFLINQVIEFDKKHAKALFNSVRQANITTRNFPMTAENLRRQYKIKDGGNIYIFATTAYDEKKILIVCDKIK